MARKTFAILTVGAAGMACLLALLPATGHDQMWFLYVAGRVLAGTRLYGPELVISNPPLIAWMLIVPSAAAKALHLPATLVFKTTVLLVAGAVAWAGWRLLRRVYGAIGPAARWSFAFAFVAIFGVVPARDFGQRDYLIGLVCLPYLLSAALPVERRLGSLAGVAIGVAAALGLALKPQYLLVPLAVEILLLVWRRSGWPLQRPEPWAVLGTCLVYLGAIRLWTPGYLAWVVPVLHETYWGISHLSVAESFRSAIELHVVAVVAFAVYFGGSRPRGLPVAVLLTGGVAATVAYYVQATGWYYQQLPGISFFAAAVWLRGWEICGGSGWRLPRWSAWGAAVLSAVALALTAGFSGYRLSDPLHFPSGLPDSPAAAFFSGLPMGTPVTILSTSVDETVTPIYTQHIFLAQRTNVPWMLPAILRYESPGGAAGHAISPGRVAELDAMQHQWMAEDIARWQPALILVERCGEAAVRCQYLEDRREDLLWWFEQDPAFRAEFAKYRFWRAGRRFDAYVRMK